MSTKPNAAPARSLFSVLSVVALVAASAAAQSPITAGNLVVLRVGDGVAALSNASTATFLDEFTTAGVLVQTIAMPTAASGANLPCTNSGTATSEGFLNVSENGQYLLSGGYGIAPGTASIAGTTSAVAPRVIARIGLNGVVDTTSALGTSFSAGNIRSAFSTDGNDMWASGSNSGVVYTTLGLGSGLSLNSAPANSRVLGSYGGQLYVSSASGQFQGVAMVGTGHPTTAGQTATLLAGFPTASGPSNYDFFFADASTLYVADDRSSGAGGIQKWTESGGTWTLQYTLAASATAGCRGLTGIVNAGVATLFATTSGPVNGNDLVTVTDTGPTSTFTVVTTAPALTAFRGVRLVTGSSTLSRITNGCGTTTIAATGSGAMGNSVVTTVGNYTGLPFLGFGLLISNVPICPACSLGHEWSVSLFGSTSTFAVPVNPAYLGIQIGVQGAEVFGSNMCVTLPVTLTDTIVITIS